MTDTLHFQIGGGLLILLAVSHAWFPRRFQWRQDTAAMSLLNRQMFYVHAFFLALGLLLNGLLFLGWANLLTPPGPLARVLLAGLALFWSCRLFTQLFVYDRRLWLGHIGNTIIHVLFVFLWVYLAGICALGALA